MGRYDTQLAEIADICGLLQERLAAQAVLLFDRSGQCVTSRGDTEAIDDTALAALIVAHMASTKMLGEIIGETFETAHHEASKHNLYLSAVAGRAVLVLIVSPKTRVGLVRVRVRVAVQELCSIIDGMLKTEQELGPEAEAQGQAMETGGIPGVSRSML